ncbi:MAG: FeoB-associated Cys-rich membrane protein [Oscillospiraceae bacterium]
MNIPTIIISIGLAVLLIFIVRKMVHDKRRGKGCGCGCASCPGRDSCR